MNSSGCDPGIGRIVHCTRSPLPSGRTMRNLVAYSERDAIARWSGLDLGAVFGMHGREEHGRRRRGALRIDAQDPTQLGRDGVSSQRAGFHTKLPIRLSRLDLGEANGIARTNEPRDAP
jgi:hypothetical protein